MNSVAGLFVLLSAGCLIAGVYVLAGVGSALIAAAFSFFAVATMLALGARNNG